MKIYLIAAVLLLLISGNALAGSEYDKCIKEEKALKAQEAGDCSGFKHLLNPSACFATRKVLKEYAGGDKCRKIGLAENVDFSVQAVTTERKGHSTNVSDGGKADGVGVKKSELELPQQENTVEQLKAENARLRAEISRIKTENELLRKAVRQP